MKQATRKILLEILLFGFLLAALQIIISLVFSCFYTEKTTMEEANGELILLMLVNQLLFIGLLLLGLVRVAKRFSKPGYWWLVLCAFGMLVVNYHFSYAYNLFDYYTIHQPPEKPSGDDMEKFMEWVYEVSKNPPPNYNLVIYLLGALFVNLYNAFFRFNMVWVIYFLITGLPTMPLWVSGLALLYSRKKKNKMQ